MRRFLILACGVLAAQSSFGPAHASQQRLVYEITVTNPGSKSQGWHGTLYDRSGQPVQAEPSTRVKTIAGEFESVAESQPWVPYGMIHGDTLRWLKEHGADVIFDSEPWAYKLYVTNEGTKSQGFRGELLRGRGVVTPEVRWRARQDADGDVRLAQDPLRLGLARLDSRLVVRVGSSAIMPRRCDTSQLRPRAIPNRGSRFLRRLSAHFGIASFAAICGLSMLGPYTHAQEATQRNLFFSAWGSFFETIPTEPMPWGGIDNIAFVGDVTVDDAGHATGNVRVGVIMQAEHCCLSPDPIKEYYGYKGTRTYGCRIANPEAIPDDPIWRLRKERGLLPWSEKGLSGPIAVAGRVEGTDIDITMPSEVAVTCEIFRGRGNASAGNPLIGTVARTLPVPESLRHLKLSLADPKKIIAGGQDGTPLSATEYSIPDPTELGARDKYGQFSGSACRAHVFDPLTIAGQGAPPQFQYQQCIMYWGALSLGKEDLEVSAERKIVLPVTGAAADVRKSATQRPGFEIHAERGPTFNIIHFTVPDTASNREAIKADKFHIRAGIASQSSKGRLFHADRATGGFPFFEEGSAELDWAASDVKLGEEETFYYRWMGDPPKELYAELIKFEVFKLGKTASRTVGFEVGMDLEITSIERALGGDAWTDHAEPLVIKIRDRFHPKSDPAELLSKLGVTPVLRVRRCGYQPFLVDEMVRYIPDRLLSLIQTIVPQLKKHSHVATSDKELSSIVESTADLWAIPVASDGTLQIRDQQPAPIPSIRFQGLGDHAFEVDIGGVVAGTDFRPLGSEKDIELRDPKATWPQQGCSDNPLYQDWYQPNPGGCPDNCWIWNWSEKKDKKPLEFTKNTLKISVTQVPAEDRLANAIIACLKTFVGKSIPTCLYRAVVVAPGAIIDLFGDSKKSRLEAGALITSEIMASNAAPKVAPGTKGEPQSIATAGSIASVLRELKDMHVVLVSREGIGELEATSAIAGRLQAGRTAQEISQLPSAQEKAKSEAVSDILPAARILSDPRYTIVPVGNDESLKLSLTGGGKPGEVLVVTADSVTRVPFPAERWQSSIEVSPDGKVSNLSGTPLKPSRSSIAPLPPNGPVTPGGPEQPEPSTPATGVEPKPSIGGQCQYESYAGTCTIIASTKTDASIRQSKISGGPGYEGYEVSFAFTSSSPIAAPEGQRAMRDRHVLRLTNSWYPGPRFLDKYAIAPGKSFACTLRVRTKGACAPILFDFTKIDAADMFEGR